MEDKLFVDNYASSGCYTIAKYPDPVGYWILDPGGTMYTKFAMFKRPTDEQIKNTEELLGWKWQNYEQNHKEA